MLEERAGDLTPRLYGYATGVRVRGPRDGRGPWRGWLLFGLAGPLAAGAAWVLGLDPAALVPALVGRLPR